MLRLAVILVLSVLAQQTLADEPEAIVGGSPASPGEFPHQVSLRYNGGHVCGASIIDSTHILTAAHCVLGLIPFSLKIVTGTNNNRAGNTYLVKHIRMHPGYVHHSSRSYVNDIAVIRLYSPIKFNELQKPIPLASSQPLAGTPCILSGWGKTETTARQVPQFLQKMTAKVVNHSDCQKDYGSQPIYETHLCALNKQGIGACQGDSGGPLICNGQQSGIVSFSRPCGTGVPDVYTSVFRYRDFIETSVAEK